MTGSPTTVLLTGAGGAAVPALIESLQRTGYRVLAADMDPNAIGLYTADTGFVIPGGRSPEFFSAIRNICQKEHVKAFIPLVDEELAASCDMEQEGVAVLLPQKDFVATSLDKLALMKKLGENGILAPKTRLATLDAPDISFPCIVKPRTGRGSRGVGLVRSESELQSFLKTSSYPREELLVQEYIDGPEYTVSVVVWRDGEVQAVVPKEIISKRGITQLAVTRKDPRIDALCRSVQERLRANGPFNVQLRMDTARKMPMIFEINPRFSTSISLTIAAGVDELGDLLAQALDRNKKPCSYDWREGLVLMRRTADTFLSESDFRSRGARIQGWQP